MTNKEKYKEVFGLEIDDTSDCGFFDCTDRASCKDCPVKDTKDWWNVEYKEPTTHSLDVAIDIMCKYQKIFDKYEILTASFEDSDSPEVRSKKIDEFCIDTMRGIIGEHYAERIGYGMSSPCANCGSDLRVCIECDLYNGVWISKDQYEARLKSDMVAMLTEIQLEIEELDSRAGYDGNGMPTFSTDYIRKKKVNELVQQKINKLKENKNDN